MALDAALHQEKESLLTELLSGPLRRDCLLSGKPLSGEEFSHRGVPYVVSECGHVQSKHLPPRGYLDSLGFDRIYPRLDQQDYLRRRDSIYRPKLDWLWQVLLQQGWTESRLLNAVWSDLGSGAGYYLSALESKGCSQIMGFEADANLVNIANALLVGQCNHLWQGDLADLIFEYPAEVYSAFFVMEHVDPCHLFWRACQRLPKGTIFYFSVPVFGMSCLLERCFAQNHARNLDSVIHTQLYTDQSIQFALQEAGFSCLGEWVFGQDASDLTRFLHLNLGMENAPQFAESLMGSLRRAEDAVQQAWDHSWLADQRHIIAIKS